MTSSVFSQIEAAEVRLVELVSRLEPCRLRDECAQLLGALRKVKQHAAELRLALGLGQLLVAFGDALDAAAAALRAREDSAAKRRLTETKAAPREAIAS
jgi:hypothetical protein